MFVCGLWPREGRGAHQVLTSCNGSCRGTPAPDYPPLYFIVAAAAREELLPEMPGLSLYGDREESVYEHYNEEIRRHIQAGHLLAERDAEIARLRRQLQKPWWQRLFRRS